MQIFKNHQLITITTFDRLQMNKISYLGYPSQLALCYPVTSVNP